MHEHVHAETGDAGDADGKVQFVFLLELGFLVVGENAVDEGFGIVGRQFAAIAAGDQIAPNAHHRRTHGGQVQI